MSGPQSAREIEAWLNSLTDADRAKMSDLLLGSEFAKWAPNPGPQARGYISEADELFFGGAAGGGKTGLLVGLALMKHQRSLILRRESTQLRGFLDDVARILKTRDGLNKQDGQWRIPASDAWCEDQIIEFGGVPNPGDEERHQGIPHDLLAFDEVTQFPEYIIDYLSTWNRSIKPGQRCRIVLTSNPPTPSTKTGNGGGQWLLRRYAPWLDPQYRDPLGLGPAKPGELRWFVSLNGIEQEWPDGLPFMHEIPAGPKKGEMEMIKPKSRTFIPALVTDNPYLGADYIATLQKLSEPLRSAMLYGDFSVSLSDQPMQLFPASWVRASVQRWREMKTANPPPTHNVPQTALGVDVGRGGADPSIIQARYGAYYPEPIEIPAGVATDGPEVASHIVKHRRDNSVVRVDANGVGASVFDHCNKTLNMDNLQSHVGSEKSNRTDRSGRLGFVNLRSEALWRLRESLDPEGPEQIAIPDDETLITELLTMTWEEQGGKVKVIPKKDLIKLLGHSPDRSDALALANMVYDETSDYALQVTSAREQRLEDARRGSEGGVGGRLGRRPARFDGHARWGDRNISRRA